MAKSYPTATRLRELLHYCPETGAFTWKNPTSYKMKDGSPAGTINDRGYIKIAIEGSLYRAHRLAWIYCHGDHVLPEQIDHIDGDKLNNRLSNLRAANQSQNNQNRAQQRGLNSLGAHFCKATGKWRSRIKVGGKQIALGNFDSIEDAHAAYREAKATIHTYNPTVPDRLSKSAL